MRISCSSLVGCLCLFPYIGFDIVQVLVYSPDDKLFVVVLCALCVNCDIPCFYLVKLFVFIIILLLLFL